MTKPNLNQPISSTSYGHTMGEVDLPFTQFEKKEALRNYHSQKRDNHQKATVRLMMVSAVVIIGTIGAAIVAGPASPIIAIAGLKAGLAGGYLGIAGAGLSKLKSMFHEKKEWSTRDLSGEKLDKRFSKIKNPMKLLT